MAILTTSTISRMAETAHLDFTFPAAIVQFDWSAAGGLVTSPAVPTFVDSAAVDYIAAVRDLSLWIRTCETAFGLKSGNPPITRKVEIEASPTEVTVKTTVNGVDHTTKWSKATGIVKFKRNAVSLSWEHFAWWVNVLETFAAMVLER